VIMGKNKDVAKVSDGIEEKKQDELFLEYSEEEGSPVFKIARTGKSLHKATGFRKDAAGEYILSAVLNALVKGKDDLEKGTAIGNQVLSVMAALNPRDGFEGLLVAQMLLTHTQAINCLRAADNNISFAEIYFSLQNQAIKLMRLYSQQLEALNKHRNKGKQKMTIKHVHINQGAQAIIGDIVQEGGGVKNENRK